MDTSKDCKSKEPEPEEKINFLIDNIERENTETVELLFPSCCANRVECARGRGERLLQTHTPIGQEIQLSSSCPIRDEELYLLSNHNMSLK